LDITNNKEGKENPKMTGEKDITLLKMQKKVVKKEKRKTC
jgi:hypothetical protein